MPTKIRLQRQGKKGQPFYHIVIADGRAPRDGKYIERIGTYNPLVKPADINLDFDRALYWLQVGAQPTDTARAILSYKGVIYKNHLMVGVKKGAHTEEQANAKFDSWLKEKEEKIKGKVSEAESEIRSELKKRLDAEKKVNQERAEEIAAKRAAELKAKEEKKVAAAKADMEARGEVVETEEAPAETEVAEEVVAEAVVEEPAAEVVVEEKAEEVVAEEPVVEDVKAEEPKEDAPVAEAKEEESKEEEKKAE